MTTHLGRALPLVGLCWALASCGTPPPSAAVAPTAPVTAAPPLSAPPTAAPVASAEIAPPAATSDPNVTVIHVADIFGEMISRVGKTVTISSHLSTSSTEPQIGNTGVVLQATDSTTGERWVPVADIEIKTKLDKNGRISVTIKSEKKDLPEGTKIVPFAPKSRLRLRWEWQ